MILRKYINIWVFLFLSCVVFAVYYPFLQFGFFSDDYHMLAIARDNQLGFWKLFTTNLLGNNIGHSYGPLYKLFFILEYKLFGLSAFGYHIMNLLLHTVISFFIFLFVRLFTKRIYVAFVAALFFVVLPNHTSSLAWVGVQPHLLATVGYIGAVYWYYRFRVVSGNWRDYFLSLIFVFLGLWSKDTVITIFGVFFLIDLFVAKSFVFSCKSIKSSLLGYLPLFLIGVLYLYFRSLSTGSAAGVYNGSSIFSFVSLLLMFVEITANMFVSFPLRFEVTSWLLNHLVVSLFLGLILLSFIFFIFKKEWRKFVFLFLIYCVSVIPFLFVSYNSINNEGERYAYLPSVFFVIIFALSLYYLINFFKGGKKVYLFVSTLLLVLMVSFAISKQGAWVRANDLVSGIVDTQIELSGDIPVVFIGLPDNVLGAQVFRNGIFEMWRLEKNQRLFGERIPLYTFFDQENFFVDFEKIGDDYFFFSGSKTSFTGFPIFESEYGVFELQDFERRGNVGSGIKFSSNEVLPLQLVYFSNGQLYIKKIE